MKCSTVAIERSAHRNRKALRAAATVTLALALAAGCERGGGEQAEHSNEGASPNADQSPQQDNTDDTPAQAGTEASEDEGPTGPTPPEGWELVDEAALDEAQQARLTDMRSARSALGQRLSQRLVTTIQDEGIVAAVRVCSEEAPQIASEVAEQYNVDVGRTSFRVRNPANTPPPEWAQPWVEAREPGPATLLNNETHELAELAPIQTAQLCTRCHGARESLDDELLAALDAAYPEDQATGFEEGELRGWFVVSAAFE